MSSNKASGLLERYGDTVELSAEDGSALTYRILSELSVGSGFYAVLQSEDAGQEDEVEIFRIVKDPDGEPQLETVTDEDEWDRVEEAFDDLQFGSDERP